MSTAAAGAPDCATTGHTAVANGTVIKVERGRVLDRGRRIDPDSLALARHIVYWTRAGKAHSAPIE
ncbi:MAG TPA: hypothetical protein VJT75_18140 [Thermoleophilaceae bacterium]|nr:hypothetical protein [Thermoleophilaceae bacterium]